MQKRARLFFQVFIFTLIAYIAIAQMDIEAYCPFGGILSFGTQIYQNTMACNMSASAIFMGIALFIGALAIGKLFCSYYCPVGAISEWFGKIGKKMHLHFTLPPFIDRPLRIFKYGLLFATLYFTTTSSELFCRKFDPYFGVASNFSTDVVLLWSVAAIVIVIAGAILFKQFWCKYLCPLGAISNMFINFYTWLIPLLIFLLLNILNINLSIFWIFAVIVTFAYVIEIGLFKFTPLPVTKITVDHQKCTNCLLCDRACPYGINVSSYTKVTHPDCMLCSECLHSCSKENAITINQSAKLTWAPLILAVILPLTGYLASLKWEFKTIEKRWGNYGKSDHIHSYQQSGIDNLSCYGSAITLYEKIKDHSGIVGLMRMQNLNL